MKYGFFLNKSLYVDLYYFYLCLGQFCTNKYIVYMLCNILHVFVSMLNVVLALLSE